MPNRVVREGIIDSDRVDQLSWGGECFYRRLHSVVDDYGCYDARTSILKSKLYPTEKKQAIVSLPDIEKWMTESVNAGLVRCYVVANKKYLMVMDFNQTIRIKRRKYPPPPDDIENVPNTCVADALHVSAENKPNQSGFETESRSENKPEKKIVANANFSFFIENFNLITKRNFKGSKKLESHLNARMKEGFTMDQISTAITNCFNDSFHQQNPQHLTPEFILRNDKLQKYLNYTKSEIQLNGFPNGYNSEFEKKLETKKLPLYWAHLRTLGLEPKKVHGKTVDWVKIVQQ